VRLVGLIKKGLQQCMKIIAQFRYQNAY